MESFLEFIQTAFLRALEWELALILIRLFFGLFVVLTVPNNLACDMFLYVIVFPISV